MFKKEDNIKYFIGGAAAGVAAGLFVGTLFPASKSNSKRENAKSVVENRDKRVQDDNIYNSLYSKKNVPHCHPRSKSASRYEDINMKNTSVSLDAHKKPLLDTGNDNIQNSRLQYKTKVNYDDMSCLDKNHLCNISIEDNDEISSYKEDTNLATNTCNEKYSKQKHYIKQKLPVSEDKANSGEVLIAKINHVGKTQVNNLSNMDIALSPKEINTNNLNIKNEERKEEFSNTSPRISMSNMINNLTNCLGANENTALNNLPHIQNAPNVSHLFKTQIDSFVTNMLSSDTINTIATCNTILNFEENHDDEENRTLNFTESEFHEIDLISSTKRNNFDDL